jgi:hypothetical protein
MTTVSRILNAMLTTEAQIPYVRGTSGICASVVKELDVDHNPRRCHIVLAGPAWFSV